MRDGDLTGGKEEKSIIGVIWVSSHTWLKFSHDPFLVN